MMMMMLVQLLPLLLLLVLPAFCLSPCHYLSYSHSHSFFLSTPSMGLFLGILGIQEVTF